MSKDKEAISAFTRSHNFIPDYELLRNVIKGRPEAKVLTFAIREYQFALYAVAAGNYRHAFISLRLFFELSLSTIHFSASEIKYRKWLAKIDDIAWAALIDRENGIYSVSFISAFNQELAPSGRQYAALAEKVYRECSEHVHGNFHTHPTDDTPIAFEKSTVMAWNGLSETVRLCILFAYAARFLKLLPLEDRNKLEPIMLESLGELLAIQGLYT